MNVIPTCAADRYWSMWSIWWRASFALRDPSFAASSMRVRRARTSANSAATKNPFNRISTSSRTRRSAVKWS